MPDAWCSEADAEKRARCGVPRDGALQTEPALALEMVQGVAERGQLPFQWVAADAHYGMNPTLLDGVAGLGKCYCAEVPQTTDVWPEEVKSLPPGPGPRGAPRTGRRVGLRNTASARSAAARRATDSGRLATVPDQGRGQRAAHGCVRLCAGNEPAWTPSWPPGVGYLPPGSGARGGDHVLRE